MSRASEGPGFVPVSTPAPAPAGRIEPPRILLVIGGGVAAFKSLELVRELRRRGHRVRCVLTEGAKHFVTPLSAAALSGDKVYEDLFSLTDEAEMGHIELSRDADLLVVAPTTADLMAKMANGLANDLASTLLLATDKRVLAAPAMNVRMWLHPATRRNRARLEADGVAFVGPDEGEMACGEFGPGRMAEPIAIADAVERLLAEGATRLPALAAPVLDLDAPVLPSRAEAVAVRLAAPRTARAPLEGPKPLAGRRVLVTSGPTREPIDPVRYLSNHSSGRQGHAIAAAAARAGAHVVLVSGPVTIPTPAGVEMIDVETALEMQEAVNRALAAAPVDVAVFCAAVADWRVDRAAHHKLKKPERDGANPPPALALVENPDILREAARPGRHRPRLVVGFAAETENVIENARAKRGRKGCDWIVANDVGAGTGTFGGDTNAVHLVTAEGVESWPRLDKAEVAARLIERAALALGPTAAQNDPGETRSGRSPSAQAS